MKVTISREKCWALSKQFLKNRCFLGLFCWDNFTSPGIMGVALFRTRKDAKKAQKTCFYLKTRVEKVRVTIEIIE